ncbi:MAG: hypothetical protein O3A13_13620 [Proteobacteria bacterium]|nr:hypothetical protein [Pseudomonadota bacterium]
MNSHNAKPDFSFHKTPVVGKDYVEEAKIVGLRLRNDVDLSIADEQDSGCDPYNATGQHVILKQRKFSKD